MSRQRLPAYEGPQCLLGDLHNHCGIFHGHGLTGVWARQGTRRDISEALCVRRTVALTGDRIALQFTLNGQPMGSVVPASRQRRRRRGALRRRPPEERPWACSSPTFVACGPPATGPPERRSISLD